MTYLYQDQEYTLSELRAVLPHISLPAQPTAESLAPLGVSVIPNPEPDAETLLALAKADRLALLNAAFASVTARGHFGSSLGFEVDANVDADRNVRGLITRLESTGEEHVLFCDYGNAMHTVTLAQLKALQLEIILYGQMLYGHKWELRTRIEAADSPAAVADVEINFDTLPAPVLPTGGHEAA